MRSGDARTPSKRGQGARSTAACVALMAWTLAAGIDASRAQAQAQAAAQPQAREQPADPSGAEVEARALYAAGQAAFGEGRFQNALEYFQRAYVLSGRPGLLYNLGATYDRLRRDTEALDAFERYLREQPDADNRHEVEARVAVLREAIARTAVQTPPPPPPVEPPVTPPASSPPVAAPSQVVSSDAGPAPWIVVGIGGAACVAGAVLLGVAAADVASVEGATRGTRWSAVEGAYGRSEAESIAGAVLLGVGGAAAVAGLAWGVAGAGGSRVEVAPSAGGVFVRGAF